MSPETRVALQWVQDLWGDRTTTPDEALAMAAVRAELAKPEPTRFDMDGSMEPSEHGRWVRYEDIV